MYPCRMSRYGTLSPGDFTDKAADLLHRACPDRDDTPVFNAMMAVAKAQGMSWIEGLEYVIERRTHAVN